MGGANQYLLNLLAQGIGRVCTFGANFAIFVLIARIGGAEFFGQYSYVITFLGVFVLIADFGMTFALSRDIAQPHESLESYWGNFIIIHVALSFIAVAFCIVAAYYMRRDLFPIMLVGALALPFLSGRFFEPVFQVRKRPWFSMYSSIFYALCSLLFLLLAFHIAVSLTLAVMAFICANVAYALYAYYLAQRSLKPAFALKRTVIANILRVAVPFGVSALFTVVSARIPIFMLAAMKSDYAVGIFNAAYRFFDLSAMMGVMIVSPLVPIFSAKAVGDRDSLKMISSMIVDLVGIFAFPLAIITPLVSPFIVKTFFGANFLPSAEVLNVLVWSGICVFFSLLASASALSLGIVHFAYWNTASAAVLSIVLNYILIPRFSFVGSAWVTLVCEIFLAGVSFCFVTIRLGNIFKGGQWIKIVAANVVLCGLVHCSIPEMNPFLKVIGSLAVYTLLIVLLKAIPRESIWLLNEGISKLKTRYAG